MKITALVENTSCKEGIQAEHGLSLFIEAQEKTILFDTGASPMFAQNAEKLHVNLETVDLAVLSHGHYDHSRGIDTFLKLNGVAPIYLRKAAFGPYYSEREGGKYEFIGIDESLITNNRLIFTGKQTPLGEGISLFSNVRGERFFPTGNKSLLKKTEDGYIPDDFTHEQNLVIEEDGISLLISGCSHRGIVNIVDHFHALFGHYPTHVIGGFHLYNHRTGKPESNETLHQIADALLASGATYYTCHCTGEANYQVLRTFMGDKVEYLAGGRTLDLEAAQ
ncbi:MAG TPA: MBL fold metallo-hydrolase [Sphaerochaeta sp.]|nr:MBL fold metallo-hydrolase [Sphaerochaeta sp.]